MINHEPQDTSPLDRRKAGSNPTNERNHTPRQTNGRIEIGGRPHYSVHCNYDLVNMKGQFVVGKLERILNAVKRNVTIGILLIAGTVASIADAGGLYIECDAGLGKPGVYLKHITGATEDYGSYDALFLPLPWNPAIDFYSKTFLPSPADKLMKDSRPPESTSTFNLEISGRGLSSPENAELDSLIYKPYGEDNFYWKNIIGELYNNGDVDDSNNLLGVYDMKCIDRTDTKIPLTINNGVSYQLLVKFVHYTDFNRDRLINGLDFKIFRENFNRNNETDPNTFGSYVGSEPNNYNAYADIDRNGTVDYGDLDIFKTYFKLPGDLNSDGRVGLDDFAYLANDWNIGDANFYDLQAFGGDYLRDINEPGTW